MILTVITKPGAKENKIVGWRDAGTLIVAIAAPPVEGKANQELIKFLADQLGLPKSAIQIKRGHASRFKHLSVPDQTDLTNIK